MLNKNSEANLKIKLNDVEMGKNYENDEDKEERKSDNYVEDYKEENEI